VAIDYRRRDRSPEPENSAVTELTRVVEVSRRVAESVHPGSLRPFPLMDLVPTMGGFALSSGSGAAIVYADVTDAAPETWNLQISAAVAVDVPHGPRIGMWLNELNYRSVEGKYYYRVTADGQLSAVIWETLLWSPLLKQPGGEHGSRAVRWLGQVLGRALAVSSDEAADFTERFGGRILSSTEQDLAVLFKASSG
jgi:hypothetical protein